jgi:hypothetical protein
MDKPDESLSNLNGPQISSLVWRAIDRKLYQVLLGIALVYAATLIAVYCFEVNLIELCAALGVLGPVFGFLGIVTFQAGAKQKLSPLAVVIALATLAGLGFASLYAAAQISAAC